VSEQNCAWKVCAAGVVAMLERPRRSLVDIEAGTKVKEAILLWNDQSSVTNSVFVNFGVG
jgi:hypothetical protein